MLFDSHCHIYGEYYDDIDKIIDNFKKNNLKYVINNAVNYSTIIEVLKLNEKYPSLLPAIGYQPEEVDDKIDYNIIEKNINRAVAIGEIGLDYYYSESTKEKQLEVFEKQLNLAKKYNKPVIIHSRNAFDDTINLLKKYNLRGVWHCFSSTLSEAKQIIDLGFKLGIGGILTFKNSDLDEVVKEIDLKYIVLETDSPYLSPVPYRGTKNEPKNIDIILKKICDIKKINEKEAIKILNDNMKEIFDIY